MALVACMALCSLPVPLTIPVIPAHTPLPAICAQEAPKAIDLGVCVKWAAKDIGPEADIPEGWRLPTLAEIRELREACTQSVEEKDGAELIVFTAKNGNSVSFLYHMGSRSARQSIRGQQISVLASLTQFLIMHTLQKQAFDGIEIKRPAICGAFAADCSALVTPTGNPL